MSYVIVVTLVHLNLLLSKANFGSGQHQSANFRHRSAEEMLSVRQDGDIILGGLFPLHEDGSANQKHCGEIKIDRGIQRMEAMLFAVDRINDDQNLLPTVKLGVLALDTCSQDSHALEQTLEFVKSSVTTNNADQYECPYGNQPIYTPSKPIAVVIGAASSQVSVMVANVLRLFRIPQISYSSTSVELSDKARFEYFVRVVPPDNLQAQAMVAIVEQLGWTYVSAVADEGNYGESGIEAFRKLAAKRNICLARYEKLRRNYQAKDFLDVVRRLKNIQTNNEQYGARGVIMFVNEDNIVKILRSAKELNLLHYFAWVASDSWGQKSYPVSKDPDAAAGAITVMPKLTTVKGFNDYFLNLTKDNLNRNVWFAEYWTKQFGCLLSDKSCDENRLSPEDFRQESFVPFVIDAVYTAAYALHDFLQDRCGDDLERECSLRVHLDGTELITYVKNVSFISMQGNIVELDKNGDRIGQYNIYQFLSSDDSGYYKKVGEWDNGLILNTSALEDGFIDEVPESVCRQVCRAGEFRKLATESCCWYCQPCEEFSIVVNETECISCSLDAVPDTNFSVCIPKTVEFMKWSSYWAIVPALVAVMGIAATGCVTYVFIAYINTPIIKASGRELCYFMLTGILLSYIMTFILLSPPSIVFCAILRVGLGLGLCLCYAAILTKTNRLSRIFRKNLTTQAPPCIRPLAQILICSIICCIQIIGAVIWAIVEPPGAIIVHPTRRTAVLSCHRSTYALIIPLLYNAILVILCTVYAVKTRKIPENFNETKHIGFTMYSTCVVWLAFVPIYFGTKDFRIQITSLCLCTSICATVPLICFFAPKAYICVFQPEKNVRVATLTCLRDQQMSFLQQQMKFVRNLIPPGVAPTNHFTSTTEAPTASDYVLDRSDDEPRSLNESSIRKRSSTLSATLKQNRSSMPRARVDRSLSSRARIIPEKLMKQARSRKDKGNDHPHHNSNNNNNNSTTSNTNTNTNNNSNINNTGSNNSNNLPYGGKSSLPSSITSSLDLPSINGFTSHKSTDARFLVAAMITDQVSTKLYTDRSSSMSLTDLYSPYNDMCQAANVDRSLSDYISYAGQSSPVVERVSGSGGSTGSRSTKILDLLSEIESMPGTVV